MTKWVYSFSGGAADGNAGMRDLLGGKGANLAEMSALGLLVPPGFTISTEVCSHFTAQKGTYPDGLDEQVSAALSDVEAALGARFGERDNPLLVSVRSGARASARERGRRLRGVELHAAGRGDAPGRPEHARRRRGPGHGRPHVPQRARGLTAA